MGEKLEPVTKEWFEEMKARLEANGFKVVNKWRKGTTSVKLGDLVLDEKPPIPSPLLDGEKTG